MGRELLRLHDAQVRRDGNIILDVDDLVIEEGEHVAILGPNGSGKSTLIKLLTREYLPLWKEEPPVVFRGNPRATLAEINQTVGVVSTSVQDRMMVHRTVLDIVLGGFFGSVGVPFHLGASDEQVSKAHQAIRELGIASLAERDMLTLSTGQARRALIARALINGPDVLVFDEPTAHLDIETELALKETMLGLMDDKLVFFATHRLHWMRDMDRVIVIEDGRIVEQGTCEELLGANGAFTRLAAEARGGAR